MDKTFFPRIKRQQFCISNDEELNKRVRDDLEEITQFLSVEVSDPTIGLWGGFSYGEGLIKKKKDKIIYVSDYDIIVFIDSFFEYVKALKNKKLVAMKNKKMDIVRGLCVPENALENVDLQIIWLPAIKLRLKNFFAPVILKGDEDIRSLLKRRFNYKDSSERYFQDAIHYYLRILREKNEYKKQTHYIKAVKSLVRYLILPKTRDLYQYSTRNNIKFLQENCSFSKDNNAWIISILQRSLTDKHIEVQTDDVERLRNLILLHINPIDNHLRNFFAFKYNIRYFLFELKRLRAPNIFVSPRKRYLRQVKEFVGLSISDSKKKIALIEKLIDYHHLK